MIRYHRHTLANGLRVVVNHDPTGTMACVNVLYDTGARDESRRLTGIAHLFEHLMFGGSANVPSFDAELSAAGGESNAWTSNDFTNFYDCLPARNIETALHLESDRMLALSFSPRVLETQRSVVIEEFKQQCLNRPYGDLTHGLRDILYGHDHPYSWPVIGLTPEHIARVTEDDVRHWFYTHYSPDNAVIAVAGNIEPDRCFALIEKWFGDIPARHPTRRALPGPGFPTADVALTMHGNVPDAMLVKAIQGTAYGTDEYYIDDCITDLLGASRSGRFYRNLVAGGDGTITDADASVSGSEHEGFMMLTARLSDAGAADSAGRALMEQLGRLERPGEVSRHELERAHAFFETNRELGNLDVRSRAFNLALAEMHGEDINSGMQRRLAITVDDIRRRAAALMATPTATVTYLPAQNGTGTTLDC